MADESSLVKLLAQKFKLLAPGQVKQAIETLPPGQKPAGVAGAVVANPNNSKKLFEEFPLQLAKALRLLLTKGTPLEERSKTQVATAALASAAAYAKNAAGRFSTSASGALMNVWETIQCAYSQLPSLSILKTTSARVPIWSERYGRVTPALIQDLVKRFGAVKAPEMIGEISGLRIPRVAPFKERYEAHDLSALESMVPSDVLQKLKNKIKEKPRVSVNNTRYNTNVEALYKKLRAGGASVSAAARAAHAAASTSGARATWTRTPIKKSPFNISGIMGAFSGIARIARTAKSKSDVRKGLNQFVATGVSAPWVQAIKLRLNRATTPEEVSKIAKNFANRVEGFATGNVSGAVIPPLIKVPPLGPAPPPPPPSFNNKWFEDSKNMNRKSIQNLVKLRRNYPARKSDINRFLGEKVEKLVSNSGRSGTSSIKEVLRLMKNVPNLPGKDRVFDLIEQRIQDIEYDARNNPVTAKERLRRFKSSIGYSGGLFGNRNLGRIFSNAEREYNRKIADNRRRKMNENRNRRGLAPLPANNRRPNNYAAPRGNMGGVFRPPPNQPVPNLRAPNMAPPMNMGPPLNMGEVKAINNVGGANKALNLVQNAGGSNEVLRAANQLKEAGGSPELAVAKGANAKNIKIVLQLGGANNATKVATAAPKLRRRKRSKKVKKTKGKGRPKISAIKKLLRSLPKKKLLAVLPKSNKASMANKNKANVATRVTSYLSGRTKK
jgi:hypothetical protein